MNIQAIVETAIYVDDLDAAEDFYGRVLGLRVIGKEAGRHLGLLPELRQEGEGAGQARRPRRGGPGEGSGQEPRRDQRAPAADHDADAASVDRFGNPFPVRHPRIEVRNMADHRRSLRPPVLLANIRRCDLIH